MVSGNGAQVDDVTITRRRSVHHSLLLILRDISEEIKDFKERGAGRTGAMMMLQLLVGAPYTIPCFRSSGISRSGNGNG